jgi:hypothetical protein
VGVGVGAAGELCRSFWRPTHALLLLYAFMRCV